MSEPRDLLSLTTRHFRHLTRAERLLIHAAQYAINANCNGPVVMNEDCHPVAAPANDPRWTTDHDIRAELVAWLCTDMTAKRLVNSFGIRIFAARIQGALNVEHAIVSFPLVITGCLCASNIQLSGSRLQMLYLTGTRCQAISAERVTTTESVYLRRGFISSGGVRLLGARIGGSLQCEGGTFSNPNGAALLADGAEIKGMVDLSNGFYSTGEISFSNASIGLVIECGRGEFSNPGGYALRLDGADVAGGVFLHNGFRARGEVRMLDATIRQSLNCSNGFFENKASLALNGDRVRIDGSIFMISGFRADGGVRFAGATVEGNVECQNGQFSNSQGQALNADGIRVRGGIFLRDGFEAVGEVRLPGAVIGTDLDCSDGMFFNPGLQALQVNNTEIRNAIRIGSGFSATGEVNLSGSRASELDCRGASLTNAEGTALSADAVELKSNALIGGGTSITGSVRMLGARIGGRIDFSGSQFLRSVDADNASKTQTVNLEQASIVQSLMWRNIGIHDRLRLNLGFAKVGIFEVDWASLPNCDNSVILDGFTYNQIPIESGSAHELRRWTRNSVEWIRRQHRFSAQPYEQLASVLRTHGYEEQSRDVSIEMQNDIRKIGQLPVSAWLWKWILRLFMGYGYRPFLALLWGSLVVVVSGILFLIGYYEGELIRTNENAGGHFNPLFYSLDVFLPIIDLGLREQWTPDGRGVFGVILQICYWMEVVVGWIMSSIFVIGFTSLVRK